MLIPAEVYCHIDMLTARCLPAADEDLSTLESVAWGLAMRVKAQARMAFATFLTKSGPAILASFFSAYLAPTLRLLCTRPEVGDKAVLYDDTPLRFFAKSEFRLHFEPCVLSQHGWDQDGHKLHASACAR